MAEGGLLVNEDRAFLVWVEELLEGIMEPGVLDDEVTAASLREAEEDVKAGR